jgi:hypothetical protein
VHCVEPAGGVAPDDERWIRPKYAGFFLPGKVLSRVCRGKFVEALRAYDRSDLDLAGGSEHLRERVGALEVHRLLIVLVSPPGVQRARAPRLRPRFRAGAASA